MMSTRNHTTEPRSAKPEPKTRVLRTAQAASTAVWPALALFWLFFLAIALYGEMRTTSDLRAETSALREQVRIDKACMGAHTTPAQWSECIER